MGGGKKFNSKPNYDKMNRDRAQSEQKTTSGGNAPNNDNQRKESADATLDNLLETIGKIKSDAYNSFNTASQILTWVKNDAPDLFGDISAEVTRSRDSVNGNIQKLSGNVGRLLADSQQTQQNLNKLGQEISNRLGNQTNALNNTLNKTFGELRESTARISAKQKQDFDEISRRFDMFDGRLKGISDNTDVIQSLRGDIADINETLRDAKIEREFPTVNQDEETIRQLAECGAEIFNRLAIAARWYARSKPSIEHMSDFENNLRAELDAAKAAEFKRGCVEGRKQFIKDLLVKYNSVHEIFTNENMRVLATILQNEGVECASGYTVGDVIEITQENFDRISGLQPKHPGKIRILTPAYFFDGQVIENATFEDFVEPAPEIPAEPAPETTAESVPETPVEPAPEMPAEPAPETPAEPAPETPAEPAPETTVGDASIETPAAPDNNNQEEQPSDKQGG